jgi:hypothetical protein
MKKRRINILFLFGIAVSLAGCASHQKNISVAPSLLPNVTRPMKTAGFWISRHADPDKLVLDDSQIAALNSKLVAELGVTTDISVFPSKVSGADLRKELENQLRSFVSKTFYFANGSVVGQNYFDQIKAQMDLFKINSEVPVRFGFIVHYADQRLLPAADILTAEPGDIDFDEVQNSALDVGTPIAILHDSRDGEWFYGRGHSSSGWVRKEFVALCQHNDIREWQAKPFLVSLSPKVDIFRDVERRQYYDFVQMGTRFPLIEEREQGVATILFPNRAEDGTLVWREGYVNAADVHEGYLKYTPRNIIEQAFKLLNAPYGWGGMNGEQDCSRFLQEVFATVGIDLPRNSAEQIKVCPALATFNEKTKLKQKLDILRSQAPGGITLLYMKGHIMLSLGTVDNEPYAIHATWAYRENNGSKETVRVINKVTVSDLNLGADSKKGSLLSRLQKIAVISSAE